MSCPRTFDQELLSRYAAGEASEAEASDFEVHALECADCAAALETLVLARELLRAQPVRRSRPAWATAAALAVAGLLAGGLLGRWSRPTAPDVFRAAGAPDALPVEQVLELSPDRPTRARRATTLLACPVPATSGVERLDASLKAPGGRTLWEGRNVTPASGRVLVAVDLREAGSGAWTLEVIRADAAGTQLSAQACVAEVP